VASSTVRGGDAELPRLRRVALKFMRAMKLEGAELSLTLVSDRQIRRLNRDWRKKDKATDVLSFPSGDAAELGVAQRRSLLGDVVISVETARRVAKRHGVAVRSELTLYLAHGLLHLLGFDHHRRADRKAMATEELRLLGVSGMLTRQ
jgi:probable rRNA maturation factor